MLILDMIIGGIAIAAVSTLVIYIRHSGAKAEKQKQIEQENSLLKQGEQDAKNTKAEETAKYTNDITAAHNRLHNDVRD